jgi:5-methylcytosine-specific restriction endonuclease McrA
LCQQCAKAGRLDPATVVDHIISINNGGHPFPALDELMSLCAPCYNRKSNIVEQQNKELINKGCGINGNPLDCSHPWYR